jgi:hypothetical protein
MSEAVQAAARHSPVYNFCRAPSHRIELHAFLRSFCRAQAIALSSMRSAEVSVVPEPSH